MSIPDSTPDRPTPALVLGGPAETSTATPYDDAEPPLSLGGPPQAPGALQTPELPLAAGSTYSAEPYVAEPHGADETGTGEPAGDVLDPETDDRNEPVGIDRKFVLAGLAIAGTVFCLLLLLFGGDGADDAVAQAPPPTPPPGAYIDEQTAGYYGDGDLAGPVTGTSSDPYAVDPYAADPYAADPYGSSYPPPRADYATTQAYSPTPSSAGSGARAGSVAPAATERDAFDRAVLSPLLVGSGRAPEPEPTAVSPERAEELAYMREIAEIFPTAPPPPAYGPGSTVPADPAAAASLPPQSGGREATRSPGAPLGDRGAGPGTRAAFLDRTSQPVADRRSAYDVAVRPATARPLTLHAGSVVPAALVTGMNSELPGTVIAQVTRNVYDSVAQRDVLIPAGTRLVGEYDDQIAYGQGRALVAWSRMLFPDGSSVDLPGLPGVDLQGYSGLADEVNRHVGRVFGAAVLLAAIGAGVELAAPQRGTFGGSPSPQEVASRQVAIELSRVATEVVKRELDVEPTIRVAPGYRFYVLLARDLSFAGPYRPRPDVGRFPRNGLPRR